VTLFPYTTLFRSKALRKFIRAAEAVGMSAEIITKDDYAKIVQFDGLFIRDTTYIENHTYRFARKAEGEGLVVMDDPQSILRCTNKVYLAELMARHGVAIPRTVVAHEDNAHQFRMKLVLLEVMLLELQNLQPCG
jgi:glutathione synthase/RimK-type ligase-like ATP-grasp enzyme